MSLLAWVKMRIKEGRFPPVTPEDIASVWQKADAARLNSASLRPRVTWIGHATVLVQHHGINFLTDPHLSERAGPLNFAFPKRLVPPALTKQAMPKIDFIVISHNHYDHLDHRTVDMYGSSVTWFVPKGLKTWFIDRGVAANNVQELEWWQSFAFNEDVCITFTPAVHWSKRGLWDNNKSLWGSWSVNINGFKSWFAGDTAYNKQVFKEIGQREGPFDVAFIPIGAYGPRYFMLRQHVDPHDAVCIHEDIRSTRTIPIHWGTFQLTHEPFLEPPALLKQELQTRGLPLEEFSRCNIGETVEIEI